MREEIHLKNILVIETVSNISPIPNACLDLLELHRSSTMSDLYKWMTNPPLVYFSYYNLLDSIKSIFGRNEELYVKITKVAGFIKIGEYGFF